MTVTKLDVQPTVDTVHQVSTRISNVIKVPVARQQLLFQGQQLHRDGRTLAEHGVVAGSKLHLVIRAKSYMTADPHA